jgi:oligopeptide/dipeptide ABC transporter ATP-binding protein
LGDLLAVKGLKTYFLTTPKPIRAVDDVSFSIKQGETLGLVGESGSGKTMTALSILRLLPNFAKIIQGEILFNGKDLVKVTEEEIREIRGNKISMIFQDPMTSLNPVYNVGFQISEAILAHKKMRRSEVYRRVLELMELVGIPSSEKRMKDFPHEFSGGMRQRIMIAMALACNPQLLIADEPTTALDVTIQAQVLELMKELRAKIGTSILLITHDLGVIAEMCNKVAVMYAGQIVEYADVHSIFKRPTHPYTIGLLKSLPGLNVGLGKKLYSIEGVVPDMINVPSGCRFHPRCKEAMDRCRSEVPLFYSVKSGHYTRCFLYSDLECKVDVY